MSLNKVSKPVKTKAEFIAENSALYNRKFNFLPAKQIKGKLEEDWKKLYGIKRVQPIVSKVIPEFLPKPVPKVMIKPEILITPVEPEDPLKSNNGTTTTTRTTKRTIAEDDCKLKIIQETVVEHCSNSKGVDKGDHVGDDDHDDDHNNQIKRKALKEESKRPNRLRSKKDKLETTIELLSEDNKSIGFIESKGSDTYLKLHNGKTVPWAHSTPVRVTRNNSHFREISRLPFSPI